MIKSLHHHGKDWSPSSLLHRLDIVISSEVKDQWLHNGLLTHQPSCCRGCHHYLNTWKGAIEGECSTSFRVEIQKASAFSWSLTSHSQNWCKRQASCLSRSSAPMLPPSAVILLVSWDPRTSSLTLDFSWTSALLNGPILSQSTATSNLTHPLPKSTTQTWADVLCLLENSTF